MIEDDSVDPDDIAYVGDEDDERGPGCLVAIALACGGLGFVGFVGSFLWLYANDSFEGVANNGRPDPFSFILIGLVMFLSVMAGGFGVGLGLFVGVKTRLSANPKMIILLARIAAVLGGVAAIGVVAQIMILILTFRR